MPSERSPRTRKTTPPDATSRRFAIDDLAYRLHYYARGTAARPAEGVVAIPSSDGVGTFWLVPEAIRLARPE